MRIHCEGCALEFDLPDGDWQDSVACPRCRREIRLQHVKTVPYRESDLLELSPQAGFRPEEVGEGETLRTGCLIGQYRIEGFLGRGGMGAVYRARHTMLQREVALKVLPPKLAKDAEFVERFHREAKVLATLSHPNIVAVHDMGVQGEIYYFVMELVDGVTMREILAAKKLSPSEALKIVPQLCEALEYAHTKGVIHRDIKPENILVDREGHPKIGDFGLAKIVKGETAAQGPLTKTNVVMGTVEYMAPEQRDAMKTVDHRADIYSLGVLLYEMLTGELPVGRFELPSQRVKIDISIDGVVLKALERDPDRRYQRASHMGTAVAGVSGDIHLRYGVAQSVSLAGGRVRLSPRHREKIGVYLIVNAALFLFFGLIAGNVVAPTIIAIFWGMALALNVWKAQGRGEGVRAPAPAGMGEAPRRPRTSRLAVAGFLLAVIVALACVAIAALLVIEREGMDQAGARGGFRIAIVYSAVTWGLLAGLVFFLCFASRAHVRRSGGTLKGLGWAQGGALLAAVSPLFPLGLVYGSDPGFALRVLAARVAGDEHWKAVLLGAALVVPSALLLLGLFLQGREGSTEGKARRTSLLAVACLFCGMAAVGMAFLGWSGLWILDHLDGIAGEAIDLDRRGAYLSAAIVAVSGLLPAIGAFLLWFAARAAIRESDGALRGRALYRMGIVLAVAAACVVFVGRHSLLRHIREQAVRDQRTSTPPDRLEDLLRRAA